MKYNDQQDVVMGEFRAQFAQEWSVNPSGWYTSARFDCFSAFSDIQGLLSNVESRYPILDIAWPPLYPDRA